MNRKKSVETLLSFIEGSPSPFHTVVQSKDLLQKAGFTELFATQPWKIKAGGNYYIDIYGSSLLAFRIGANPQQGGLRLAAAHTDFPCFRVKTSAGIVKEGYGTLNVESYGGMILSTWLDRPLSLAGKVVLRSEELFAPEVRFIDMKRPLLTIPNLAIHMNRKINEGIALNRQKDMLPLAMMLEKEEKDKDFFDRFLAKELGCKQKDILSYELTVYPTEKGSLFGFAEEFISSPRLDNLTSVKACLCGIIDGSRKNGISGIALFDNEEVGSRTKQGAGSLVLTQTLQRIYECIGLKQEDYYSDVAGGYMLSVDVAHALHPNVPTKTDPTNKPVLNGGVVLKLAANQSYAGDAEAVAIAAELCQRNNIPCQRFVNRSDMVGGSTLGSIASTLLPIRTMDIGVPILAMHSARETMGVKDQQSLEDMMKAFFSEK